MTTNKKKLQNRIDELNIEAAAAPPEYANPLGAEVIKIAEKCLIESEGMYPGSDSNLIFKNARTLVRVNGIRQKWARPACDDASWLLGSLI